MIMHWSCFNIAMTYLIFWRINPTEFFKSSNNCKETQIFHMGKAKFLWGRRVKIWKDHQFWLFSIDSRILSARSEVTNLKLLIFNYEICWCQLSDRVIQNILMMNLLKYSIKWCCSEWLKIWLPIYLRCW